jgi:hypothetical protein
LVQDRCTVCTEHTMGIEIVLDTLDGNSLVTRLKWKLGSVCLGIVLLLMQDWCLVCTKCSIGIEIVLDALEGTPR